jgi:deazaflavin-dependent oxidoreductase (nitroreductase family)
MSDEESESTSTPVNDFNQSVIKEFRANGGKLGGPFEGAPVLLLHTTGARSGRERVNPMMYFEDDGHTYVFASKAGADTHPDWYHNLVAHPDVTAEFGAETVAAQAVPLEETERQRIFGIGAERNPGFAEYQAKTSRLIPVVELVWTRPTEHSADAEEPRTKD